ncbi:MAG: hypothetical protein MUF78_11055, partial [Candidatus Edwardsbacteria bacterium]|nr:hypothetical protein [Candidatus Edwardsbacteria bacterium]
MKRTFALFLALAALAGLCLAAQPTPSSGPAPAAPSRSPGALAPSAAPAAVTWATIDSISPAATAAACNGKVYRFSGNTPTGTSQPVVQEFDPAVGAWVTKNALPFGIYNAPSATWRDRILLFSGQHYISGVTNQVDSLVIYYPDGDSVQAIDGAPYRAGFASCAVIADTLYDGKVYVFGGRNAGVDQSAVLMYSPTADTAGGAPWTTKTSMATARGGLGAALIGQYAYVFGGGWNSYLATVARYDPIADSVGGTPWSDETGMSFGRRTIGATALGNNAYVVGGYSATFRACVERGLADAAVYNDAAVAQIEIPQQLGNYGVVVPPYVLVTNNSPVTHHNIPVTLTIDSAGTQVYEATSFVTLGTGAS